jgi:hypothetical protein
MNLISLCLLSNRPFLDLPKKKKKKKRLDAVGCLGKNDGHSSYTQSLYPVLSSPGNEHNYEREREFPTRPEASVGKRVDDPNV